MILSLIHMTMILFTKYYLLFWASDDMEIIIFHYENTLPKTNIFALKIGRNPKGKDRLPTHSIHVWYMYLHLP